MTKLFWRVAAVAFGVALSVHYGGLPWPVGLCVILFAVCFLYGLDWLSRIAYRQRKKDLADAAAFANKIALEAFAPNFTQAASDYKQWEAGHEKRMRDLRDELVFRIGFFACAEGKDVEEALSDFKSRHH